MFSPQSGQKRRNIFLSAWPAVSLQVTVVSAEEECISITTLNTIHFIVMIVKFAQMITRSFGTDHFMLRMWQLSRPQMQGESHYFSFIYYLKKKNLLKWRNQNWNEQSINDSLPADQLPPYRSCPGCCVKIVEHGYSRNILVSFSIALKRFLSQRNYCLGTGCAS